MRWASFAVILGVLLVVGGGYVRQGSLAPPYRAEAQTPTPTLTAAPTLTTTPTPRPSPTPTPTAIPPILPYFAFGDSLTAGVGASAPGTKGYVPVFAQRAWPILSLPLGPGAHWNLGIPGETSTSMLAPGGQLEKALVELNRRQKDSDPANDIRIITISIGGNDVLGALRRPECTPDPGAQVCVDLLLGQVVPGLEENLSRIFGALREAAGPQVPILILTLYNPYSGTGTPLDLLGDVFLPEINKLYFRVAPQWDVRVVDIFPVFQGQGPELTNILRGDIHPNDEGYQRIAEALAERLNAQLGLATPTPPPSPAVVALPDTGGGPGEGHDTSWPYALIAAGLVLLVLGLSGRRWARR